MTVVTGSIGWSGTRNHVYVTLVGEYGKSSRALLNRCLHLSTGAVSTSVEDCMYCIYSKLTFFCHVLLLGENYN